MKKDPLFGFGGLTSLLGTLSQHTETLTRFNYESYSELVDRMAKPWTTGFAVADIVGREMALLSSMGKIIEHKSTIDAIERHWDVMAKIAGAYKTPEIFKLQQSLLKNDFTALQTFADALTNVRHIEAPNIAFLKMVDTLETVKIPRGLSSIVKDLHVDTANRLISSNVISFDLGTKTFFVEESPEEKATVRETNILCSALRVLSNLDEADLIVFMNYMENNVAFANTHRIGRIINETISKWDNFMDFDCEYYYHARALEFAEHPYTEEELGKAPVGYTGQGRYNFTGQSHYYFSDETKGAYMEVKKHTDKRYVQIAKLKPKRTIKMINLSQEITTQNKFLEYCRLKPKLSQYPLVKREYLLPCYVASCCKANGIDGIKYYGSKEYRNYVAWEDNYFSVVNSEVQKFL